MPVTRLKWLRAAVLALYALAVSALGVTHRPPAGLDAHGWQALAGQDATVLCLSHQGGEAPTVSSAPCDACLLMAAPGLPPAAADAIPAVFFSAERPSPGAEQVCPAQRASGSHRPRAPPASV